MKKDLKSKRFGRLIVVGYAGKNSRGENMWECQCDCGNKKVVRDHSLLRGYTKSCGCFHNKQLSNMAKKHGMCKTKLYRVWEGIRARCRNKTDKSYKYYGGKGIKVCEEWQDASCFLTWAKENGYKEGLEIDRINNNGNYEPNNCRFITRKENLRNTGRNKRWYINGVMFESASLAAKAFNVSKSTIQAWCNGYRNYKAKNGCYSEFKHDTRR